MSLVPADSAHQIVPIRVLGPLQVTAPDGTQVPVAARKHAELLIILALERVPRTAQYLAELLWRGRPPASAVVTVQGYVSRLRKSLAPIPNVSIDTEVSGYVLRCNETGTDLDLLDGLSRDGLAAVAAGDLEAGVVVLERAIDLWRGEPFGEVADVAELAPELTRLAHLRSEMIETCGAGLIGLGRAARAVTLLGDEHVREPLDEGTARLYALALRDVGRQGEALTVLADLRRRLVNELGLDPAADTERVEQDIRVGRQIDDRVLSPATSMLVGRDEIAQTLDKAWDRSTTRLTTVLLRGPAGVGKTALADDLMRRHDAQWLALNGSRDGTAPALAGIVELAADLGAQIGEPVSTVNLARALAASARRTGHLRLVVDDVQWVDPDSLQILAGALRRVRANPVLVVLTCRTGTLDASVAAALSELSRVGDHGEITVGALDSDATATLVRGQLGAAAAAQVIADITDASAGNPYLAGRLCDIVSSGESAVDGAVAAARLVEIRLAGAGRAARRAAELLSVAGGSMSVALAGALSADGTDVDEPWSELAAAGLIDLGPDLAFVHDLTGEAVAATLGPTRRAELHRTIADALSALFPEQLAALAIHRSEGAPGAIDADAAVACRDAAVDALSAGAFNDALAFAERGVRHCRGSGAPAIELRQLGAAAAVRLGRFEQADEYLSAAASLAESAGDWPALARTALVAAPRGVAGFFSGYGMVHTGSTGLITRALAKATDLDDDVVAQLRALEATHRAVHGLSGGSDMLAAAQVKSMPGAPSWPQVRLAEFITHWDPTTVDQRQKIANELGDLAGADIDAQATALHLQRVCALESGDLRLVRRLSAEFSRIAGDVVSDDLAAMGLWWQVMMALLRGDQDRSRALTTSFVEQAAEMTGSARMLADVSTATSESIALWHRGELGSMIEQFDALTDEFDDDFALVVALGSAERGDFDRALRLVDQILGSGGPPPGPRSAIQLPLLVEALVAVAQSPSHREQAQAAMRIVEPGVAGWGEALVVQWPGLVCLGPAGLYRGSARGVLGFEGARAEVLDAADRARRLGARPYELRARRRLEQWPFSER